MFVNYRLTAVLSSMSELSNKKEIVAFIHCGLCVVEYKDRTAKGELEGISPGDFQRLEIGWTEPGFQVWCRRHDVNVLHIDFQGHRHPANQTRFVEEPKKTPN